MIEYHGLPSGQTPRPRIFRDHEAWRRSVTDGVKARWQAYNKAHPIAPRHERLIALLVEDKTIEEAAAALGLTVQTAREYLKQARARAHTRTNIRLAVAWATGKLNPVA